MHTPKQPCPSGPRNQERGVFSCSLETDWKSEQRFWVCGSMFIMGSLVSLPTSQEVKDSKLGCDRTGHLNHGLSGSESVLFMPKALLSTVCPMGQEHPPELVGNAGPTLTS